MAFLNNKYVFISGTLFFCFYVFFLFFFCFYAFAFKFAQPIFLDTFSLVLLVWHRVLRNLRELGESCFQSGTRSYDLPRFLGNDWRRGSAWFSGLQTSAHLFLVIDSTDDPWTPRAILKSRNLRNDLLRSSHEKFEGSNYTIFFFFFWKK